MIGCSGCVIGFAMFMMILLNLLYVSLVILGLIVH
jgi:hypothetical protein